MLIRDAAEIGHLAEALKNFCRYWKILTAIFKKDIPFFDALKKFDDYLASDSPLGRPCEKIFQGPIADALTHVGQLAMLRRLAGSPVGGENYHKAEIETGRVGPEQSAKRMEFDRENETGKIIFVQ